MSTRGYSRRTAPLIIVAVLVLVAVAPTGFGAGKSFPEDPVVTSAGKRAERAELSAALVPRLSGLVNNNIAVTYTAGTGEILACAGARIRFTLDGTSPSATSPRVDQGGTPTNPSTCGTPVGAQIAYTFVLVPANFSTAAANALVTFRLEPRVNNGNQIDDNGGLFYKYRLDRSRAQITSSTPSAVPQSTLGKVVATSLLKPPISFVLADNDAEAPLNQSTFAVLIDDVDRTTAFNCTFTSFTATCNLDYTKLPANFQFAPGAHTIKPTGADTANNQFDPVASVLQLRVDRTAPLVQNITITPNQQGGTSGGLPVVSRGANVTVKVNVADTNLNRNATDAAQAILFNATNTAIPLSPAFNLKFNATSGKFEGNATVPTTWPQEAFGVRVRVLGKDQAGNVGQNNTTADAFILDPILPVIEEATPPGPFIRDTPTRITAKITDVGSGLDPDQVKLTYTNVTGSFKNIPSTSTRVGTSLNTFEAKMTRIGTSDNYTYEIPGAEPGSVVAYQIAAKDKAGGPASTPLRTLTVDIDGPVVTEVGPRSFRSLTPYQFEFVITDAGAGVNTTAGKLFFSTGGSFQSADLVAVGDAGRFVATISPSVTDGQEVRYYAEAKDLLNNVGRNGTASAPRISRVDLVAPTITSVTSPATASTTTFLVEWAATDARSGVANFTLEARVNDGTPSIWIPVLRGTPDRSVQFCGEGGNTYEFRVAATDFAGNTGVMPANPQATTVLTGEGCAEEVAVSVISPSAGQLVDASSGPFSVRFSASSTRTFTPSNELRVDVLFSPDGTFWHTIATGVQNTGSQALNLADLPNCNACKVRVIAKTLTGASQEDTSGSFTIRNANNDADLDGNGLPDSWEVQHAGKVGTLKPSGDEDKDGLDNLAESRLGTDPNNSDTDNDGASDRAESRAGRDPLDALDTPTLVEARTDEYTNWYWAVPGLFVAVAILFFVGLARRW